MKIIDNYVTEKFKKIYVSKERKNELLIEIFDHLYESANDEIKKGKNEDEAQELSIKKFGGVNLMLNWYEKRSSQLFIAYFSFILFYILTYIVAHGWLDISKYSESNIIAFLPTILTGLLIISLTKSEEGVKALFKLCIIPLFLIEKLALPIISYISLNNHEFLSFAQYSGFSKDKYINYLFNGQVGGIDYYSLYYIITSLFLLFFTYLLLVKITQAEINQNFLSLTLQLNVLLIGSFLIYGVVDDRILQNEVNLTTITIVFTILIILNLCLLGWYKMKEKPITT